MGKSRGIGSTSTSGTGKSVGGGLTIKIESIQKKIKKLETDNMKLFDLASGFRDGTDSAEWKKWNNNKTEIRKLEDELIKLKAKNKKEQSEETKIFVNGFGEATTRYITNGTYEKVQKRTQTNVTNFLTNGKSK